MEPQNQELDRREFLRTSLRRLVLAGLGLLGGSLLLRKASPDASHVCINDGICRGCRAFSDCILPPAASAKQHMNGQAEMTR